MDGTERGSLRLQLKFRPREQTERRRDTDNAHETQNRPGSGGRDSSSILQSRLASQPVEPREEDRPLDPMLCFCFASVYRSAVLPFCTFCTRRLLVGVLTNPRGTKTKVPSR